MPSDDSLFSTAYAGRTPFPPSCRVCRLDAPSNAWPEGWTQRKDQMGIAADVCPDCYGRDLPEMAGRKGRRR